MQNLSYLNIPLPWQTTLWQQLQKRFENNNLPHALLLTGEEGFGQGLFAKGLAKFIIAGVDAQQAHLFDGGNHPDFILLRPEEGSSVIKIDQIRDLQKKLSQASHSSKYRVVIFEPAHALNTAASNALLKLVEEPNPNTFLLFITNQPRKLSITLRSRCQKIKFGLANRAASLQWLREQLPTPTAAEYFLNLAEGAPLKALVLAEPAMQQLRKDFLLDINAVLSQQTAPSKVAEKWAKQDADNLLRLLSIWLLDLTRLHHQALNVNAIPQRYYEILCQWQNKLALGALFAIVEKIFESRRLLSSIASLNSQNILESIFIDLAKESPS